MTAWICSQLSMGRGRGQSVRGAVQALCVLLRLDEARISFGRHGGVAYLTKIIRMQVRDCDGSHTSGQIVPVLGCSNSKGVRSLAAMLHTYIGVGTHGISRMNHRWRRYAPMLLCSYAFKVRWRRSTCTLCRDANAPFCVSILWIVLRRYFEAGCDVPPLSIRSAREQFLLELAPCLSHVAVVRSFAFEICTTRCPEDAPLVLWIFLFCPPFPTCCPRPLCALTPS